MQILKRLNSRLKTPHLYINRILFHSFPPGPTFQVKGDVSTLRRNVPHGTAQVFRLLTRHTESRTPPQHRKWELRTFTMITTEATPFLVRSSRRLKLRCQEFRLGCMKLVVTQQAVGFHVGQPAEFALVNGIWMQVGWKASCWFQSRFCGFAASTEYFLPLFLSEPLVNQKVYQAKVQSKWLLSLSSHQPKHA